ncbi:hypothetical protein CANMA_005131 [Candida margitis]|uniref:uncharacterized protein n=1 Tax=Candida margitis TaxID=1775924 RepID=UPI0022267A38|nr:uncharacterized protein CANMA_005131 [Candida margitis]KAI5952052.1 hypothetical protein CANMA_005131 [Candida margitis]
MKFFSRDLDKLKGPLDGILTEVTTFNQGVDPPLVAPSCTIGLTQKDKTVYLNTKGVTNLNTKEPATNDHLYALFSCTKSMTVMGALILYERGQLDLDAPVSKYIPEISSVGVLEPGIIDKKTGEFKKPLEPPKTQITARHLMTHTAGFSYGFIHPDYFTLITKGQPKLDASNPTLEFFLKKAPLVFEPGSNWMYGYSIDWLGFAIEKISGQKLGEFLKKEIFDPVGMASCTFHKKDYNNMNRVHYRKQDASLKLQEKFGLPLDPNLDLGGQGCFGTVGDYLKFMRVWLNFGYSPDGDKRILSQKTVEYAVQNHLPENVELEFIGLAHNFVDDDAPDKKQDGWTLSGNAYNANKLPSGRPSGTLYWGGLANLSYWIDFKNGIGGFYAVQVFPYMDEYVVPYIAKFEYEVYSVVDGENASAKL